MAAASCSLPEAIKNSEKVMGKILMVFTLPTGKDSSSLSEMPSSEPATTT